MAGTISVLRADRIEVADSTFGDGPRIIFWEGNVPDMVTLSQEQLETLVQKGEAYLQDLERREKDNA